MNSISLQSALNGGWKICSSLTPNTSEEAGGIKLTIRNNVIVCQSLTGALQWNNTDLIVNIPPAQLSGQNILNTNCPVLTDTFYESFNLSFHGTVTRQARRKQIKICSPVQLSEEIDGVGRCWLDWATLLQWSGMWQLCSAQISPDTIRGSRDKYTW